MLWFYILIQSSLFQLLFFGGSDPFIASDRLQQIDSRFKELNKEYELNIYPEADHGFFCQERSSYNQLAAEDSWQELIEFFGKYLLLSI